MGSKIKEIKKSGLTRNFLPEQRETGQRHQIRPGTKLPVQARAGVSTAPGGQTRRQNQKAGERKSSFAGTSEQTRENGKGTGAATLLQAADPAEHPRRQTKSILIRNKRNSTNSGKAAKKWTPSSSKTTKKWTSSRTSTKKQLKRSIESRRSTQSEKDSRTGSQKNENISKQ